MAGTGGLRTQCLLPRIREIPFAVAKECYSAVPLRRNLMLKAIMAIAATAMIISQPAVAEEFVFEKVRLIGRFLVNKSEAGFAWPGSAIEFRFDGSYLDVVLSDSGENSMVVDVDGSISRVDLKKGLNTYHFAMVPEQTPHTVRLIRRTESRFGTTVLKGFRTDGSFLPQSPNKRSLLVIGDSISAGYGVEGEDTTCGFSADTENQYLTFGAVAARRFDADITTIAISGKGLARNYDGSTKATMLDFVDRLLPSRDMRAPLPKTDVVVVHLGSNDFSGSARPADFVERYVAFLTELRTNAPDAYIYAGIGPLLAEADLESALAAVNEVVAARNLAGDARVGQIQFTDPPGVPSRGCDWHPNEAGQRYMADQLAKRLRTDLAWAEVE